MLSKAEAIECLNSFFNGNDDRWPATCEAWQTLKAHCTQPTASNSRVMQLPKIKEFYSEAVRISGNDMNQGEYVLVKGLYDYLERQQS